MHVRPVHHCRQGNTHSLIVPQLAVLTQKMLASEGVCMRRFVLGVNPVCAQVGPVDLQAFYGASEDMSYMEYDADDLESAMQATFHDMSQMELQDNWARCW